MKRLKDTSGIFLLLLLGLCVISTPAFAENPWIDGPPHGTEDEHDSPGPRGGRAESDASSDSALRPLTCSGLIMDIAYHLTNFICGADSAVETVQKPSVKNVKSVSAQKVE